MTVRHAITVHVPQNDAVSYSLYALGSKSEFPRQTNDESEYTFKFRGGTAVALFYAFANIRRAFIVTGWQDGRDGNAVMLPGVDGKLCLVSMMNGGKVRVLDKILKNLAAKDEHYIFSLPLLFWHRLANIIQYGRGRGSAIKSLMDFYGTDGKSRYYSAKDWRRDGMSMTLGHKQCGRSWLCF